MDIFGSALSDYFNNGAADILWLHNSYGEPEEMPVDVFFRDESEMPELELQALNLCGGLVLDVGAGVGSHSLALQARNINVTALEISEMACSIMKDRGVNQIINQDFFAYHGPKVDTILMLMNGIGIAGKLSNLPKLLQHCKKLLNPGGMLVFDSSNISYLYEDLPRPLNNYFGDISYQYEYKGYRGNWFDWLYADQSILNNLATRNYMQLDVVNEDENDQYLATLQVQK